MGLKDEVNLVQVSVLQDLISNIQLSATDISEPNKCDEAIECQCNSFQEYLKLADYIGHLKVSHWAVSSPGGIGLNMNGWETLNMRVTNLGGLHRF